MSPASPSPPAIVVMGVSGSGKTTLARLLAAHLQCPFVEGDELHDARCVAKMSAGEPLDDDDRWPWLERIGSAVRNAVAERGSAVAACSALRRAYRQRLQTTIAVPTLFVLLDAPEPELRRRLQQRSGHFMPLSLLSSQLATLERPAHDEYALILDARRAPEALCAEVLAALNAPVHTANDASG
jgi:gluconokinase